MKVKFISKEKNDTKFEMEFSKEEFENAQVEVFKRSKDKFNIDGFRKGKAPMSMVEKHYGEGIFFEDAINELFQKEYPNALGELELEVIGSPRAEFSKIEKGKGFTITITVACEPEVEVKNYKGIEIEKVTNSVKAEDVQKEIDALQKRNARQVSVKRAAKEGDTVLFDFAGFVGDEQFQGGTAENQELKLGSGTFIPGFEDQLIGTKAGEKKDVNVTFPKEYQAKELAGKDAVFHCTIHEVKEEQLPELDDEFAKDVSEFDTLDEFKKDIKKKLTGYAKEAAKQEMQGKIIDKICEATKVDIPEEMLEDEKNRMIQELNQQLQYQGMNIEQYLKFTNSDLEKFKKDIAPEAEKRVKTKLVLNGIVAAEKIEVTDKEVDEELAKMGAQYKMDVKQVKEALGPQNLPFIKKDLKTRKAVEMLYDNAVIK